MKSDEIIQKTLEIYSGDKNHLAKYLKHYISAESKYAVLCQELLNSIDLPIFAIGGISEANLQSLRSNFYFDEDTMFDSSDYYQFVLNEDISEVEDWDFTEYIKSGSIVRLCRLFINNCLLVYHLHIQLIGNNFDTHIPNYDNYSIDIGIINCIRKGLHDQGFVQCR